MEREQNEDSLQIQLAGALTILDVQARGTERPRASQSLPVREAAAAAVGLRVLTHRDLYPGPLDGKPRPPRFDLPEWVRSYAPHINDPEAKALVLSFLDLVDACATLPKSGQSDAVVYRNVTELGSTLGLVSPAAAASASPAPSAEGASVTAQTGPAPLVAEAADVSDGVKVKRQTWQDVALPYMVEFVKKGQYKTAKEFFKALGNSAGTADSPFVLGTGDNKGSLFVPEAGQTVTLKTIQNQVWSGIKAGPKR